MRIPLITGRHSLARKAILCFCMISGSTLFAGGPISPDRYEFPSEWVLLDDRPVLWSGPGSVTARGQLRARAGANLTAESSAPGDRFAHFWIRVRHGDQSGWLPEALAAPRAPSVGSDAVETLGREPVDRFFGLPPDYAPDDLVPIDFGYEPHRTYLLRQEAARACEAMIRRAQMEGLEIKVVSAYRAYDTQRRVYVNKLKRSDWKQRTVAKPGHSEHQLGTTVDFAGSDRATLLMESFGDTPEGKWLRENAPEFGFALSYTEHNQHRTGYAPEPWHYRYYGPELAPLRHAEALGVTAP
jgi:hypothetical protein